MENNIIAVITIIIILFLLSKCVQEEIKREKAERELEEYAKEVNVMLEALLEDWEKLKNDKDCLANLSVENRAMEVENRALAVEIEKMKKQILYVKGYQACYRFNNIRLIPENEIVYNYYVEDFSSFTVRCKKGAREEVYELDQNGEIFPTRELAEKSLLDRLEKEDKAKEELKKKHKEDEQKEKKC